MKKIINSVVIVIICLFSACEEKVDYVTPDWACPVFPDEGATVKIDFFKPEEVQAFTWKVRTNSTYRVYFDIDMHFQNPVIFDMGTTDSLKIENQELLKVLRKVWPEFSSIKRFFWKVEQNTNGEISDTWRYFSAMLSIESFVDGRDGERYGAQQFILSDGSLMTLMSENLRAKVYSDGEELPYPYKSAETDDVLFNTRAGGYYPWKTAVRMTWDEAKTATLENKPVQGICPDCWHLPSYDEYNKLREHLGLWEAGNYMKDPSYWKTTGTITNSSKLSVVASGYYWNEKSTELSNPFDSDYPLSAFWTSTPRLKGLEYAWGDIALDDDKTKATLLSFYDDAETVYLQTYGIVEGTENRYYPVRCIMDDLK